MDGFVEAFRNKQAESTEFILNAYDKASEYIVTDCSVNAMSGLMSRYADYTIKEVASLEGENVLGGVYYEFHVDAEALDALILRLFYAPK